MTTKEYIENGKYISEVSTDDFIMIAVTPALSQAGTAETNTSFFIFDEPFLRGEDYPALVRIWDNEEDDIYDNL